jgi:hypothetical protein
LIIGPSQEQEPDQTEGLDGDLGQPLPAPPPASTLPAKPTVTRRRPRYPFNQDKAAEFRDFPAFVAHTYPDGWEGHLHMRWLTLEEVNGPDAASLPIQLANPDAVASLRFILNLAPDVDVEPAATRLPNTRYKYSLPEANGWKEQLLRSRDLQPHRVLYPKQLFVVKGIRLIEEDRGDQPLRWTFSTIILPRYHGLVTHNVVFGTVVEAASPAEGDDENLPLHGQKKRKVETFVRVRFQFDVINNQPDSEKEKKRSGDDRFAKMGDKGWAVLRGNDDSWALRGPRRPEDESKDPTPGDVIVIFCMALFGGSFPAEIRGLVPMSDSDSIFVVHSYKTLTPVEVQVAALLPYDQDHRLPREMLSLRPDFMRVARAQAVYVALGDHDEVLNHQAEGLFELEATYSLSWEKGRSYLDLQLTEPCRLRQVADTFEVGVLFDDLLPQEVMLSGRVQGERDPGVVRIQADTEDLSSLFNTFKSARKSYPPKVGPCRIVSVSSRQTSLYKFVTSHLDKLLLEAPLSQRNLGRELFNLRTRRSGPGGMEQDEEQGPRPEPSATQAPWFCRDDSILGITLNQRQLEVICTVAAMENSLGNRGLRLLGMPGTGKTATAALAVIWYLFTHPKAKVLFVTRTNHAATEGLVKLIPYLLKLLEKHGQEFGSRVRPLRVAASSHEKDLIASLEPFPALHVVVDKVRSAFARSQDITAFISACIDIKHPPEVDLKPTTVQIQSAKDAGGDLWVLLGEERDRTAELARLAQEYEEESVKNRNQPLPLEGGENLAALAAMTERLDELGREIRKGVMAFVEPTIVFATMDTARFWTLEEMEFSPTLLYVDEASMVTPIQAAFSVFQGGGELEGICLSGDDKQLGPFSRASGSVKRVNGTSVLDAQRERRGAGGPFPAIRLNITFRLTPDTAKLTGKFYDEDCEAHFNHEDTAWVAKYFPLPHPQQRLLLFDVHQGADDLRDKSYFNQEEVATVENVVDLMVTAGLPQNSILIITFYNAQKKHLQELCERRTWPQIRVASVDTVIGQESDVVLLSCVRAQEDEEDRVVGFLSNSNRFNVATSRAKALCVVLGDLQTLAEGLGAVTNSEYELLRRHARATFGYLRALVQGGTAFRGLGVEPCCRRPGKRWATRSRASTNRRPTGRLGTATVPPPCLCRPSRGPGVTCRRESRRPPPGTPRARRRRRSASRQDGPGSERS